MLYFFESNLKRVKDLGSNPTNLLDLRKVRIGE